MVLPPRSFRIVVLFELLVQKGVISESLMIEIVNYCIKVSYGTFLSFVYQRARFCNYGALQLQR